MTPRSSRHAVSVAPLAFSALILAIGAFQLSTIRAGHDWGADFAQYVQHARNLVEGRPYAATGYVYNPRAAATGPRAYPPVFPLLLTPVVAATWPELNLTAMKIECVAFLLVALVLIERTLRSVSRAPCRYATVAILGFNPWVWDFKDQVLSDLPFLAVVYATLLVAQRLERRDLDGSSRAWTAAAVGLLAFIATATRTVGITLIVGLVLSELARERRLTRALVIAVVVYGAGFAVQARVLPPEASYTDQLRNDPMIVVRNLDVYARALSVVWANGYWLVPRAALTGLTILLAFAGWVTRVRGGATVLETFLVPYLGIVLAWPSEQGTRFLLPILPLLFGYALATLERRNRLLPAAFVAAAFASYGARYTTLDFGPLANGVSTPSARELFTFLRSHTAPDDVIAFRKARAVSLFTGRPAVVPHVAPDDELVAYLEEVQVRWVIAGLDEENRLGGILGRHPEWFQLTFQNTDFRAFRFRFDERDGS